MTEHGSRWRKWDLHIHTPGTAVNDLFTAVGEKDAWEAYLDAVEALGELGGLGVTDYLSLENFVRLKNEKGKGRLSNVSILIPNIEFRILPVTDSNHAINIHVLACPTIADELPELLLNRLTFDYEGNPYQCTRDSLIRLGRSVRGDEQLEEHAAYSIGVGQFKVDYPQIDKAFRGSKRLRQNALIAVAQRSADGNSGIQESGLLAVRREIYRLSHAILSGNPKDRSFFLGKGTDSRAEVIRTVGSLKPCITGTDAHELEQVGVFPMDRVTWIKADPTFEGLRQIRFEPEHRIWIGPTPPPVPLHRLRQVTITLPDDTNLKWEASSSRFCFRGEYNVPFSAGLTCLIGGRGAGKSSLLNLLHEKLRPGANKFWRDRQLRDGSDSVVSINSAVTIQYAGSGGEIEFISQNEVESLALDPAALTRAMYSRLQSLDTGGALTQGMAQLRSELDALAKSEDSLQQEQDLIARQQDLNARLEGLSQLLGLYGDEVYVETTSQLQQATKDRTQLRSDRITLGKVVGDLEAVLADAPGVGTSTFGTKVTELVRDVRAAIATAVGERDLTASQPEESELDAAVNALKVELNAFLESRGLSPENLSDITAASEQRAELERELQGCRDQLAQVRERLSKVPTPISTKSQIEGEINRLLEQVNSRFRSGGAEAQRLEIRYRFDTEAAADAALNHLIGRIDQASETRPRIDHARATLERIGPILESEDADIQAGLGKDENKTGQALDIYFAAPPRLAQWRSARLRMKCDLEQFMRLDILYNGRRLETSSFGQRCTAVLVALLSLGNRPIIVDEPEAHLDSALIAGFMVDLIKEVKQHRQIIFATHNANLVVNGDAELIHILQPDETGRTVVTSTTLEDLAHRDRLLALEGGVDAFRQREDRYGLDP